jgi:hypothetical protein
VLEDAGPQTVTGFATNISAGPPDEAGQTLTFHVSNDNNALFSAQPSIDPATGNLTYTTAPNANGSTTVSVYLQDNGGTANGGIDTSPIQTFTITVTPVNDPPSFTLPSPPDQTVFQDSGPQTVTGFATNISAGPPDESGQTLTFHVSADNTALFSAQPAIDPSTGNLTYTPAAGQTGSALVTVTLQDSGGTANGGVDTSPAQTFTITVQPVNHPPTDITLTNSSIDENQPSGTTIGNLSATDPDAGQTHTFSLEASGCGSSFPDNAQFAIVGNTLQSAVSFDYELKNSYLICIRTTDSGTPAMSFDKQFTITINDVNDPPVANPDFYTGAIGNTVATFGASPSGPHVTLSGNSLIANDTDEDTGVFAHALSAVPQTVTTTLGGSVTINSDGSFIYNPPVGVKNADDTFTYHVTDSMATTAGTATIHIGGSRVWYVDSSSGSATHDGRSSSPFVDLSSLNAAGGVGDSDAAGDVIFLYRGNSGTTPYAGGIPLEANESLIGQSAGLTVDGNNLVPAGASPAVITNAGGTGIGLADGVQVNGITVSGTSGDGIAGAGVNTATVGSDVTVTNAGGNGVSLSGGNGSISVGAAISGSTGHSVLVANRTGGTATFSGTIGDTTQGISLTSNTGATVAFTGTITASTGTHPAFTAASGGTVAATGTGSTLATTTGTALDVENTTIGSSGLSFQSVSANGGNHGIVLINTGSSGGLSVTGTGSAGSGGSITGITGADVATNACASLGSSAPAGVGVYLNNTKSPSLSYLTFPGTFGNFGILGYSVNGFNLDHTTMTGTYGDNVNQDEDTVHFCTLTGSASINNDTISNGAESNLRVVNASGTLNRLTLQNDIFGFNQSTGGDGTLIEADGGTLNATVLDTTFQGSRGSPFQAVPQAGATMDLVFGLPGHGNTVHNTDANAVPFAQDLNVAAGGTLTFDVNSNHFDSASTTQALGGVLINAANGTAVATGYFRNNTIGSPGVPNSGSSGNDPALDVESNGGGALTIAIQNNQMYQWGANGAGFLVQAGAGNPTTFNVTVSNNTVAQPGTFAVANNAQAFQLNNGTLSGESFTSCLNFSGNTVNGAGTGPGGDVRLRQRFDTKVDLPGYTGAANGGTSFGDVVTYIQGRNSGSPTVTGVSSTAAGGGFFNTPGGGACPLPSF